MIQRIGVLCQDRISFGFLEGLKRRLKCGAELIEPTTGSLAKSTMMTTRQARLAWAALHKNGIELLVRFTDADEHRWQEVARHELNVFPPASSSLIVVGVATRNVEEWLAADLDYLSSFLNIDRVSLESDPNRSDAIKGAIARSRSPDEPESAVVIRLVEGAPANVFRAWLQNDSLRRFYADCRAAALRDTCETPNELEADVI